MKKNLCILLMAVLAMLSFTVLPLAQAQQSSILDSLYDIEFIPSSPRPNEVTVAEVVTFATDINRAEIIWAINGKVQKSGIGEKKFIFRTGPLGTSIILSATIKPQDGPLVTKIVEIKPAGVEIVWKAHTYIPPFYKGKALMSNESGITLTAVPHFLDTKGKEILAKNLLYKWKKGVTVLASDSGYGKNSITFPPAIRFSPLEITVEVSTLDGSSQAENTQRIEPINPQLTLYALNSLYGTMNSYALENEYATTENELMIIAVPYFFGLPVEKGAVEYGWKIDSTETEKEMGSLFTIKKTDKKIIDIFVSAANTTKSFDVAETAFTLTFK